jgi:5-hydroxyisourate hydrolase-like protein (transthyretin family)
MPGLNRFFIVAVLLLPLGLSSCGKNEANRKQTFPVTGQVYVDGSPVENVAITCVDVKGVDKEHPTMSETYTDKDGKFKISTYKSGDGVPVGDYVLTFYWGDLNLLSMTYSGPDKLNERYKDPTGSPVKFTVKQGAPTDLGKIQLTTK